MAKDFFIRHVELLKTNRLLTEQTIDAFALLCDLWQRVQEHRHKDNPKAYLDTVKAFQSLAKLFRLLPSEKPNVNESRFEDFAEVEFE